MIDTDLAEDRFVVSANGHRRAACTTGMGIENDGISGGHHINDISCQGGDGVGDGENGSDHAEWGIYFEGNTAIATHGVGLQPLGARNVFGDEEFTDFMIQTTDFGLFHFELAPRFRVGDGESFDDCDDLITTGDSEFFQLEMGIGGSMGGFVHASEDSALSGFTTATASAGTCIARSLRGCWSAGYAASGKT